MNGAGAGDRGTRRARGALGTGSRPRALGGVMAVAAAAVAVGVGVGGTLARAAGAVWSAARLAGAVLARRVGTALARRVGTALPRIAGRATARAAARAAGHGASRWRTRGWPVGEAAGDAGTTTAEYAMVTMAAVAFAGLLALVLRSDEVRGMLTDLVHRALNQ